MSRLFPFLLLLPLFLSCQSSDDRAAMQAAVAKSLRSDDEYEREYQVALPDGRTRWVVVRGRVERNGAGQATRLWQLSARPHDSRRNWRDSRHSQAPMPRAKAYPPFCGDWLWSRQYP